MSSYNPSMDSELSKATERVVATHLKMFSHSCVLSAVEVWRMWNEFPDQRKSNNFNEALAHFGEPDAVRSDISFVMAQLSNSPNGMLDDATLLRQVATGRIAAPGSRFLQMYVYSALTSKYGNDVSFSDYGMAYGKSNGHRYYSCSGCDALRAVRDLNEYIARRRMNSL
jgi:hypothetical protein